MDLTKLHRQYPGSTLVPHGAFSERELQMLAHIEKLEDLLMTFHAGDEPTDEGWAVIDAIAEAREEK
jgi:hypothetical protein